MRTQAQVLTTAGRLGRRIGRVTALVSALGIGAFSLAAGAAEGAVFDYDRSAPLSAKSSAGDATDAARVWRVSFKGAGGVTCASSAE